MSLIAGMPLNGGYGSQLACIPIVNTDLYLRDVSALGYVKPVFLHQEYKEDSSIDTLPKEIFGFTENGKQ